MASMNIGNHLKAIREEHHCTQEEIASKLGVSRQSISSWETGKTLPDILSLMRLSDIYHVSIDETVKGTDAAEQSFNRAEDWDGGSFFCSAMLNGEYIDGSEFTSPPNPFINNCDFNEERIRIAKYYYSEDYRNEISLPLNIPYTQIKLAKLLVCRRIIRESYILRLFYLFDLRITLTSGIAFDLEFNPLYEMHNVFEYVHRYVPLDDIYSIFTEFKDEASFYGGTVPANKNYLRGFKGGFQAYANEHFDEWKERNDLATLNIGYTRSFKSYNAVSDYTVYKKIPLTDEEKRRIYGGEKARRLLIGLLIFWGVIVIAMIIMNILRSS